MLTPIINLKQMVKVSWLQLTPFLKSVVIYFIILSFDFFDSNVLSTILKCVPIYCLIAFVFLMDFKFTKAYRYHQLIIGGLIFSSFGDALLDYKKGALFPFGMMAFAVAQIFYFSAFGWKKFRLFLGLIFYAFGAVAISLMFKNFDDILVFGVPIYCILLLTMGWRANARVQDINNLPKIFAAIGAVFFIASDSLIAFNKFYSPIQYSTFLIMSTYYIGQLGITLSVLDHELLPTPSGEPPSMTSTPNYLKDLKI